MPLSLSTNCGGLWFQCNVQPLVSAASSAHISCVAAVSEAKRRRKSMVKSFPPVGPKFQSTLFADDSKSPAPSNATEPPPNTDCAVDTCAFPLAVIACAALELSVKVVNPFEP